MVTHLTANKDSQQAYCRAVGSQGIRTTTSVYVTDCMDCLRAALHQSHCQLHTIRGALSVGIE